MLHKLLRNPIYAGDIRYKGKTYPGAHEPVIARELFDAVQCVFSPRQTGPKRTKHVFALRDYLVCGECGCKVTAERQKGYVYYRCTKGKGKEACSQRRYTREEPLLDQLDTVLSEIEITPEIVDMLVRDSRALDEQEIETHDQQRSELTRKIAELDSKASKLLDSYLDGIVPVDAYRVKADEIAESRRTLERRLASLRCGTADKTAQVEAVARAAMGARSQFATAETEGKRRLLAAVVLNAELTDCAIGSYQLKRPFEYLRRDPEGAFHHPWWALEDLNL